MSAKDADICSRVECDYPRGVPACRQNFCVAFGFRENLSKVEARAVADRELQKRGLSPADFADPQVTYEARRRVWTFEYAPKVKANAASYIVTRDGATGQHTLRTK